MKGSEFMNFSSQLPLQIKKFRFTPSWMKSSSQLWRNEIMVYKFNINYKELFIRLGLSGFNVLIKFDFSRRTDHHD